MRASVKVNSMASISRRHIGTLTDAKQISAKRGPEIVIEANTEALVSLWNSRQSEYVMV